MTRTLRTIVAVAALTITAAASAAPIDYSVSRTVGSVGSVVGTVTTDGTIGVLNTGNVTDWSLTIDDGSGDGPFLLSGDNSSVWVSGSLLSADADSLTFNFAGSNGFALFQNPDIGSSQNFWCVEGLASYCAGGFQGESVIRLVYSFPPGAYSPISTAQVIGTSGGATDTNGSVPEPGTLALFGLGLAGLGLLRRRKQ